MPIITAENILAQVNQLPAVERQKLIAILNRNLGGSEFPDRQSDDSTPQAEVKIPPARIISVNAEFNDRAQEYEWLRQHRSEYIGQWVALEGDQLIAYGNSAKEVFDKVDALGIELPLVLLVEDPNLHFAGF